MLDGLFMLLTLSTVMAIASFLAGSLPLTFTLSHSQLRLISTIGMGVLVGTSLIVIIPEGIETLYSASSASQTAPPRRALSTPPLSIRWPSAQPWLSPRDPPRSDASNALPNPVIPANLDSTSTTPNSGPKPGDEWDCYDDPGDLGLISRPPPPGTLPCPSASPRASASPPTPPPPPHPPRLDRPLPNPRLHANVPPGPRAGPPPPRPPNNLLPVGPLPPPPSPPPPSPQRSASPSTRSPTASPSAPAPPPLPPSPCSSSSPS